MRRAIDSGESRAIPSDPVPQVQPPMPTLQGRVLLQLQRLALTWHALRNKRGRAVMLRGDSGLVRVHDGMRQLTIPDVRRAGRFRGGINPQLDAVAAKYVGGTGYVPREGDTIVDVGAGIGEFSLWCADAGARIVAFEPDPLALACLERNVGVLPGVRILPHALWKERANLRLHGTADTTGSSLIEDGKSNSR